MTKIKNRCCYTVTLILCGTLFLTGLTGCKSTEAQVLIDGFQEAKAEVDAESSEEKTSGWQFCRVPEKTGRIRWFRCR